jgi:hypothetical protein
MTKLNIIYYSRAVRDVYYLLLVSPPANRKENSWRSAAYDSDRRMQCSAVQLDLFGSAVLKMLHSASGVPTTRLIARSEQRFACSVCFLFSKMPCVAMTSHIQRIRTYKCVYLPVCELRTIYIYTLVLFDFLRSPVESWLCFCIRFPENRVLSIVVITANVSS